MEPTFENVRKVITDVLKIDGSDLTMDTRIIEDIKADSMDQFFLIDGFSEAFDRTFTDDEAKNIKTIGDVVKLLSEKK